MEIPKEERTVKNELYQRLRRVHYSMMQRCYNPKSISYKHYGAKGVTVCEEWHDFEGFLATVDQVEGWDEELYVKDKLALDKDKIPGNKLYSPSTCRFVTPEENNKTKPNQQYYIIGYSPDKKLYEFHSANGFAKEHGLSYDNIIKCAKREQAHHKGWQFCLKEHYYDGIFKEPYSWCRYLIGLSPKGKLYRFYNASEFAREHGLLEATVIYACANGKVRHTNYWQFRFEDELDKRPFLSQEELKRPKQVRWIKAVDPEGKEYTFWNQAAFAREHGLNKSSIWNVLHGRWKHHRGWKFQFLDEQL